MSNDFEFYINFSLLEKIIMYCASGSGARISVSDGTLTILAKNQSIMEKVQEKVTIVLYFSSPGA